VLLEVSGLSVALFLEKSLIHLYAKEKRTVLNILIVEDSRNFREFFTADLRTRFPSSTVHDVVSAEDALKKISDAPPHVIFSDIRLPGASGLQLLRKVKADYPHIKVAMITAYDLPEYQDASRQHGADRFFLKDSFEWTEIEEFVRSSSPHPL
jgi:DNA-binding NarL/FixJ family response regulator